MGLVEEANLHEGFGWRRPACLAHRDEEAVPGRVEIRMSRVMFYIACDAVSNLECDRPCFISLLFFLANKYRRGKKEVLKKLKRKCIDVSVHRAIICELEKLYVITIHPICCVKKLRWEGKNLRQGRICKI